MGAEDDGTAAAQKPSGSSDSAGVARPVSKNQKRRQKKKQRREQEKSLQNARQTAAAAASAGPSGDGAAAQPQEIEYVVEKISDEDLKGMESLKSVLAKFSKPVEELVNGRGDGEEPAASGAGHQTARGEAGADGHRRLNKGPLEADDSDDDDADGPGRSQHGNELGKLGRRRRKPFERFTVAELKQAVSRPDLVETHDASSIDPLLLLQLKAMPFSVQVPQHWPQPRKFLQGKRGKERVTYELPDYIAETGINKLRTALAEQEANAKARRKARERVNPSLGKMDIDYHVLHDAFFEHQTKPPLRKHGELYFEGAENELSTAHFRPGRISPALREALGMEEGHPPPWLFQMQRYGPPPSYPSLKVPGVNAPIPSGAAWGLHPGGWGTAPVDQFGRGLFGDVLGVQSDSKAQDEVGVDMTRWGEPQTDDESEESSSHDEDEQEEKESDEEEDRENSNVGSSRPEQPQFSAEALARQSGADVQRGKRKRDDQAPAPRSTDNEAKKQLFTEVKQTKAEVGSGAFESAYKYDLPGSATAEDRAGEPARKRVKPQDDSSSSAGNGRDKPADEEDDDDLDKNFKF